jgi:hypothetical protein
MGIASSKYYRGAIPLIPKRIIIMPELYFNKGKNLTQRRQFLDYITLLTCKVQFKDLDKDTQNYYNHLTSVFA